MLVTCLVPTISYDLSSKVAKNADEKSITLRESVLELGALTAEDFDHIVRPELMIAPAHCLQDDGRLRQVVCRNVLYYLHQYIPSLTLSR
jgi:aspartate ammonia-lyase